MQAVSETLKIYIGQQFHANGLKKEFKVREKLVTFWTQHVDTDNGINTLRTGDADLRL